MKTIIKTIKIFLLVITTIGYSQVNVSVQGLQYTNNGQATVNVTNCGIIDLASSTSSTINLGITLTKPYNQVVGPRYAKSPDFEFYIPKKVPRLFGTFCFYKLTLRKVS